MRNPFSLEGKTIVITGAASGIGKATAQQCSELGASLVLMDLNETGLSQIAAELDGSVLQSIAVDLTNYEKVEDIVSHLPKVDGIASNAGIVKSLLARFNDIEDMEQIFKVNTFSHINLIQQMLVKKKFNKGASIVFTSSMSGVFCGLAGGSLYGATKSALAGYSKALALEVAPRGIRVNTVHPGMVETHLTQGSILSEEVLEEDARRNYPLGRYGKPEEIASAIVYLLSDATVWMTGTQLLIDGGYSLK